MINNESIEYVKIGYRPYFKENITDFRIYTQFEVIILIVVLSINIIFNVFEEVY